MYVGRFAGVLSIIIEPVFLEDEPNYEFMREEYVEDDEDDPEIVATRRWFDRWTGDDGHFVRFGRLVLIYTPQSKRVHVQRASIDLESA